MSMKNSNDTTGNRTRDLPACSAVPQPTAPLRVPKLLFYFVEETAHVHDMCVCVCVRVSHSCFFTTAVATSTKIIILASERNKSSCTVCAVAGSHYTVNCEITMNRLVLTI